MRRFGNTLALVAGLSLGLAAAPVWCANAEKADEPAAPVKAAAPTAAAATSAEADSAKPAADGSAAPAAVSPAATTAKSSEVSDTDDDASVNGGKELN